MAKIFNESGKGYWLEGFGCIRAEGENRPSRPWHIIILNDQGGGVMDVSKDVTMTLRAQEHGHQPIVCAAFIGGQGAKARSHSVLRQRDDADGIYPALQANSNGGQNRQGVCYAIDHVVTTGGNCTAEGPCYYKDICPTEKASGVHAVCYEVNDG